MKKIILIIGIIVSSIIVCKAQNEVLRELKVGDTLPNIVISNIHNYSSRTIELKNLDKKLVLLDFWATTCGSCIEAFPKLDTLRSKFTDLEIIAVNSYKKDTKAYVDSFLSKWEKRTGLKFNFPSILQDSILSRYFPHNEVPHYVWINSKGLIIAITNSSQITTNNIEKAISTGNLNLINKSDISDFYQPVRVKELVFQSTLRSYDKNLKKSTGNKLQGDSIFGVYFHNMTRINLIKRAYVELFRKYPSSTHVLNVKNPNLYKDSADGDTINLVCYEVTVPLKLSNEYKTSETRQYLAYDLKRAYNIRVYEEQIKLPSYIFKETPQLLLKRSKYQSPQMSWTDKYAKEKYFRKMSIKNIIEVIQRGLDRPVVNLIKDENLNNLIDVEFSNFLNPLDHQKILETLRKVGFDIILKEYDIDALVISDK